MSKSMREQLAERRTKLESGQNPGEFNAAPEPEVDADLEEEVLEEEAPEEIEEKPAEEVADEKPVEEKPADETAVAAAGAEKPAEDAFVADYKYRADGKDLEVPEYLRGIIKDKTTQEQVVNMLKKHDAFDTVSTRRDQFRTERDEARGSVQKFESAINSMRSTYQRGDIDGFLKLCEISEESMLKWATEKAKYLMGDQSYRSQVDQENRTKQQSWANESKATDYESRYQEMEARQLQTEFNYEMMRPEVSSFVASFDKAFGNGKFVEEVKNRGELAYLREQKTIAPSEVIQAMMKQYSTITSAPQQAPAAAPTSATAAKVIVKPAAKVATIPTVKGTQASPTKEGFTSLDDVRKYRKETYGK